MTTPGFTSLGSKMADVVSAHSSKHATVAHKAAHHRTTREEKRAMQRAEYNMLQHTEAGSAT